MLLSGCMANAGEEYLALPELPTQYNALQNALDNLADQNGYVTALAGAHRQPVQMIDLDADGTEEVIVFTTDSAGLCQVHVLREREEGYSVVNSVSGESADLYEVRYPTLTSDGLRGIAIAWGQAQDEFRGVTVIGMKSNSLPEVMTFSCQSYLFEDTDRDGADEIWYADRGGTQWIRSRLQRYEYDETDGFYPTGRLSLAAEAKYTIHLRAGLCDDGTPAVFADSYTEDRNRLVTDLVVELDSGLYSMTQGLAASAAATLRRSTAFSTDINGDGVLEIPVDIEDFPYWLPGSTQFLRWCDFSNENTGPVELIHTFYMSNEGLALVVPKSWGEGMQVTRWKDEADRTVYSFYETSYAADEEVRPRSETLVLRLCIGEAYRLDEMPYDNIVIREEIAIGYEIPENAPEDMRLEKYEIEYGLHLLQDRW